jgi:hypothetical protein
LRSSFLFVAVLLAFNLYSNSRSTPAVAPPGDRQISERAELLEPIQVEGLTLIPIAETTASTRTEVLVLDEAMRERLVQIREVGSGNVNELEISNAADHAVFVLAGEVILGGKQDRIVATNTLIAPHATETLPVFCVEHGRWRGETNEFTTAEVLAHDHLRGRANYAGQVDVWNEVTAANFANATTNGTDTYRTLAERQATANAAWEHRVQAALDRLSRTDRARMIGYTVAYGNELATVDMFASPALFAKLEKKLVRSYIAEAANLGLAPARPPCVHAVRDFIADADRGRLERTHESRAATTRIQRGSFVDTSNVVDGGRHLYSNYLGNRRVQRQPEPPPTTYDHHLYPSYLGNQDAAQRHLYPSYLGNARPCPARADGRLRRTSDCP